MRARPQDLSQRTYFAKHARPAAQACIDWTLPAEHIAAFVRSLDFGPYPNPLEAPKAVAGGYVLLVPELEVLPAVSASAPGTVLDVDGDAVRVATSTNEVVIPRLLTLAGESLDIAATGIIAGSRFETLPPDQAETLTRVGRGWSGTRNSGSSGFGSLPPWSFPPGTVARALNGPSLARRRQWSPRRSPPPRANPRTS